MALPFTSPLLGGLTAAAIGVSRNAEAQGCVAGAPEVHGWEATKLIKSELATRDFPVIALTARAMVGVHEQSLSAGCDDYDAERIDLDRLLGKVEAQPARAASS